MSEPLFDVTTVGEMLLRLSVPTGDRLEKATHLDVHPAGAEARSHTGRAGSLAKRRYCDNFRNGNADIEPAWFEHHTISVSDVDQESC